MNLQGKEGQGSQDAGDQGVAEATVRVSVWERKLETQAVRGGGPEAWCSSVCGTKDLSRVRDAVLGDRCGPPAVQPDRSFLISFIWCDSQSEIVVKCVPHESCLLISTPFLSVL